MLAILLDLSESATEGNTQEQVAIEIDQDLKRRLQMSLAEALLRYSPRIMTRESDDGRLIYFLDLKCQEKWIERTFSRGEVELIEEIHQLFSETVNDHFGTHSSEPEAAGFASGTSQQPARTLFQVRMAIADSAPAAQALAQHNIFWISQPGSSAKDLARLPLAGLRNLEGLLPWERLRAIEMIEEFFKTLGFQTLSDLLPFTPSAFQERWGEMGDLIFRRLKAIEANDPQPIPPFVATEPLTARVCLDFPVSLTSLLLHSVEHHLSLLFRRLEGRRLEVRKLHVLLRCEYSNAEIALEIEPSVPSRDRHFFMLLLENKLEKTFQKQAIANPIKDIEFSIDPVPEKSQQAGFLDTREQEQSKINLLSSLLQQEGLQSGFPCLSEESLPDQQLELVAQEAAELAAANWSAALSQAQGLFDEGGFRPQTRYSAGLHSAPRPSLVLKTPKRLNEQERGQLSFLSSRPTEKIETPWWDKPRFQQREYFVAKNPSGQFQWVFYDKESAGFYLHGYFD